jgi:hypothetical protein
MKNTKAPQSDKEPQNDQNTESSGEAKDDMTINKVECDVKSLIATIENSLKLKDVLTKDTRAETTATNEPISTSIADTANTLRNINSIKDELCKLRLDTCQLQYFNINVVPFLQTIDSLSRASFDLSTSVSMLTTSPIVCRKKSKLKDTIDLIYDINEQCEDVYEVLKRRINTLINYK